MLLCSANNAAMLIIKYIGVYFLASNMSLNLFGKFDTQYIKVNMKQWYIKYDYITYVNALFWLDY